MLFPHQLRKGIGFPFLLRPSKRERTDLYFESIVNDEPYYDSVKLLGGKLVIEFRTKKLSEGEEITKFITKENDLNDVEYQLMINKCYLAYGLSRITRSDGRVEFFDEGSLEERVARIDKNIESAPKYMLIMDAMWKFEDKVAKMHAEAQKPNF